MTSSEGEVSTAVVAFHVRKHLLCGGNEEASTLTACMDAYTQLHR